MARTGAKERLEGEYGKPIAELLQEVYQKRPTISQRKLAERLGVTQGQISIWLADAGLRPVRGTVLLPRPKESENAQPA